MVFASSFTKSEDDGKGGEIDREIPFLKAYTTFNIEQIDGLPDHYHYHSALARTIDYTRKQGLLHEEFVIPANAPEWLQLMIADRSVSGASEAFWNRVEDFEKRSDAQIAKDVTIALPIELTAAQNIALVRDFVQLHITAKGMVADWVYHDAPGNPHVHLMTTLRPLTEDGFGAKKLAVLGPDGNPIRNDAGKIVYELWAGSLDDFNAYRDGWFACQNRHLAMAGLDNSNSTGRATGWAVPAIN